MSHSPNQMKQKAEAMRDAEYHVKHSTVDGSPGRDHSGMDMHPGDDFYRQGEAKLQREYDSASPDMKKKFQE